MSRTSRLFTLLALLLSALLSSCANTPPPAPTFSSTPTLPVIEEWLGMQVASDQWQAETVENTIYEHGRLTHLELNGCRARILSDNPADISSYVPDWDASAVQHFYTTKMRLDLWKLKDKEGALRDTYFELFDTRGAADQNVGAQYLRRLAYVLVETGDDPIECVDAVYAVLQTLEPDSFPNIGIAQG